MICFTSEKPPCSGLKARREGGTPWRARSGREPGRGGAECCASPPQVLGGLSRGEPLVER